MSDEPLPKSEIILYQTEDGRSRIECRFENENVWMTQALMAELFQTTQQNVSLHIRNIYEEGELTPAATHKESLSVQSPATVRDFLIVRQEGRRQVSRLVAHYNLSAIIAVGYKVNSERAVQFRKWATAIIGQFTIKGYAMDDERLKNDGSILGKKYFEEQLQRIREILATERRFYQKIIGLHANHE